jgi:hypothetical protein
MCEIEYQEHKKQEIKCTHNVILRCVHATIFVVEKQWVIYILCECMCVIKLVCAILPYVTWAELQNFSRLSHKQHCLRNNLLDLKCVLILSTNF